MPRACSSSPAPPALAPFLTRQSHLYILGAMLIAIGTVVQDVVADAMSTEVVSRTDAQGNERPDNDVRVELGMVQVLGRLAVSAGVLAVAGLSGWLANFMPRQDVFLVGLIIPAISVAGVFLRGTETMERRPIDWRILGGGIASAPSWWCSASAACRSARRSSSSSDGGGLLHARAGDGGARSQHRMGILFSTIIMFAFRAAPTSATGFGGPGRAHFDAAFYGTRGRPAPCRCRDVVARQLTNPVPRRCSGSRSPGVLSFPNIALVYGAPLDRGGVRLGARSIASSMPPRHPIRAAQHGATAHAHRVLGRPAMRHLVRADGLADGIALVACNCDQVSQRHLRGRAWRIRRARSLMLGGGARLHHQSPPSCCSASAR